MLNLLAVPVEDPYEAAGNWRLEGEVFITFVEKGIDTPHGITVG